MLISVEVGESAQQIELKKKEQWTSPQKGACQHESGFVEGPAEYSISLLRDLRSMRRSQKHALAGMREERNAGTAETARSWLAS